MNELEVSIFAPERKLLEKTKATSLNLTTTEGQIQILPGHSDMVAQLETGTFSVQLKDGTQTLGVISSGFVTVESGAVRVIAETIELPSEINRNRAKEAQLKAEKMLNEASLDEASFKKYQLKLQRSIVRQSLGN